MYGIPQAGLTVPLRYLVATMEDSKSDSKGELPINDSTSDLAMHWLARGRAYPLDVPIWTG